MVKDIGYGTKLEFTVSTLHDTELGNVISFDGPSGERDAVDATTMDSASDYREYVTGLADGGTVSGTIAYDPSNSTTQAWTDALDTGAATTMLLTAPDATVVATFTAIVTGFSPSFPLGELMTAEFSCKVTGDPAWTT